MERSPLASKRRRSAARFGAAALFCLGAATVTLENSNNNNSYASIMMRRSLAADPDSRPKLFALMNIEGIASQKVTLSCHLNLAAELGRDLVLVPFRSSHYRDGQSRNHALIRLEDYFDNSTKPYLPDARWRTADPHDDTLDISILGDVKNNCVMGSVAAMATHFTAIPNGEKDKPFLSQPILIDWTSEDDENVPKSFDGLVASFETKYTPEEDACVVGRPRSNVCARSSPALLDSSVLVKKLVAKGMFNVFSKRGLSYSDENNGEASIISYNALHLRRGDKCSGQWTGPIRCGSAMDLPFIDMCRSSKKPFYVSTDETDLDFLQELRDAGCVLFDDLGLDLEREIKSHYSKLGNPKWQSLHPEALSFSMEAAIVKTARSSYTMGCSSFYYETMSYRKFHGLSPVNLFRATLGEFVEVDPNAPPRTAECLEKSVN